MFLSFRNNCVVKNVFCGEFTLLKPWTPGSLMDHGSKVPLMKVKFSTFGQDFCHIGVMRILFFQHVANYDDVAMIQVHKEAHLSFLETPKNCSACDSFCKANS